MNKEILKEIIINQQKNITPKQNFVERTSYHQLTEYVRIPHAILVKGVRRCGKSTILNQLLQKHFSGQYYYLNFEDERLLSFDVLDFNALYEVFVELYGERKIFYFDEIQNVDGWETYVRRMQDLGYKFFLTGSNASLLSKEMGTKLTGRHVDIELFPFSFQEYLRFHHWDFSLDVRYDAKARGMLRKFYVKYLQEGGMPEFVQYEQEVLLKQVYEDILFRDIISRYDIKDVKALRELGLYLLTNMTRLFSFSKLKNILSLGSITTIKNYIGYLEDSYLLFTINQFSYSLKEQMANNKKAYVIDNGLANAIAFQFSKNQGQFLENLVFIELRRRNKEIYYYKTSNNLEVDFLLRRGSHIETLIQVAYSLHDEPTKKREIKALLKAMEETGLNEGLLLTDDCFDEYVMDDKKIIVKPVYIWLLEE